MSTFIEVNEGKAAGLNEAYIKSMLQKWDLVKGMQYFVLRYTKYYHKMQAQEFVTDLFNDEKFQALFRVPQKHGEAMPLAGKVTKIDVEVVPSTATRLDVFDKLQQDASPPVVRPNGDIAKCMDDVRDGFQISDLLRDMLLNDESDNAALYSDDEKAEFLWRVFEHLALGGPCCQFEDKLEPYLEMTKRVYKQLLSVQKNASTGKVEVASAVYRVRVVETDAGCSLFPAGAAPRNTFCYVAVDPLRHLCKVWFHVFFPFW